MVALGAVTGVSDRVVRRSRPLQAGEFHAYGKDPEHWKDRDGRRESMRWIEVSLVRWMRELAEMLDMVNEHALGIGGASIAFQRRVGESVGSLACRPSNLSTSRI